MRSSTQSLQRVNVPSDSTAMLDTFTLRGASQTLERVRNFWQPVDLIDVFHGAVQYHLLRPLLQVSDLSEENKS